MSDARIVEAARLAYEWAAAYPLQGEGSDADRRAAERVYLALSEIFDSGKTPLDNSAT